MAIKFNRSQTFATNGTVTAAGLHNLIDGTDIYQALITDQTNLTSVGSGDELLIADADLTAGDAPRAVTVQALFEGGLTAGTYVGLNLTGALSYGTATGNRTVSTSATITTGTIPNLTAGTTTSTAATITTGTIPTLTSGTTTSTAANITNGTIQTLTSSTATITGGTFSGSVNSTSGTIGNLSTTLAGDFTISQGTGTLGTSGVTLGTYGGATSVPVLAIDAKGRITTASTSAITSGFTGFRNRIINGDMRIDQRNAGASVTINTSADTYTLDRFIASASGGGAFTVQRSTTAPAGFTNSLIATVTTVDSSIASGDYYSIHHKIEGNNVSDLCFGTASAKQFTVSFWVRSSVTGTYTLALGNNANNRWIVKTFSIATANTFEQKTLTFTADTSGTWETGTSTGLWMWFSLGAGTTYQGTADAWSSGTILTTSSANSWIANSGATFYITGVQLEADSTATEFERRPIGTELALCQRYYCKSYAVSVAPATSSVEGYATNGGLAGSTANSRSSHRFPVEMRATPTMSYWDYVGNASRESSHNSANSRTDNVASGSFSLTASASGFGFNDAGGSGQAGVGAWWSLVHWVASIEL